MKFIRILLVGSLLVNAVLVWVIRTHPQHPATGVSVANRAGSPNPNAASAEGEGSQTLSSTTRGSPGNTPQLWSSLGPEDLDVLVQRLRAAGFPSKTIRTILATVISHRYQTKREELLGNIEHMPYWRQYSYYSTDPKVQAQLSAYDRDMSRAYRKYFNSAETLAEDEDALASTRERFGPLPIEKLQRITQIQEDAMSRMEEESEKLQKLPRQERDMAEQRLYANYERDQQAAIARALTPEELQEYQLRQSPVANRLRTSLETFRPTEAEYKALFALYNSVEQQFSDPFDEAQGTARAAAMKQLQPQIEAALGPERYADYVQLQQGGNDKLSRLVARLDLPLAVVGQVNKVRDDITQRATAVRENPQFSDADRNQQLTTLAQEAAAKVTAVMGPRGFQEYQDIKGDWIRALTAPPKK